MTATISSQSNIAVSVDIVFSGSATETEGYDFSEN